MAQITVQYLAKNPLGYRCHANTGVKFRDRLTLARTDPVAAASHLA